MTNNSDFNFSKDEIVLLFWIKYWALQKTIQDYRIDKISSLVSSKEKALKKENEMKSLQIEWLDEWHHKTAALLKIDKNLEFLNLESSVKALEPTPGKLSAIATECATFNPYKI